MQTEFAFDKPRLSAQLACVRTIMQSGRWFTLKALQGELLVYGIHASEAGVSARIRDLRKREHGSYTIERRRITAGGLHEYRMT